jgi:hypothetical protein
VLRAVRACPWSGSGKGWACRYAVQLDNAVEENCRREKGKNKKKSLGVVGFGVVVPVCLVAHAQLK